MARRGRPAWVWLAVAGLGTVAVVGLLGAYFALTGPGRGPAPAVVPREEFRKALLGKTPDEVIRAVGRPEDTTDDGGRQMWTYRGRTKDPVTGNVDSAAFVHFKGGRVSSVDY